MTNEIKSLGDLLYFMFGKTEEELITEISTNSQICHLKHISLLTKYLEDPNFSPSLYNFFLRIVQNSEINRYFCFKSGILDILVKQIINDNTEIQKQLYTLIGSSFFSKNDLTSALTLIQSNFHKYSLPILQSFSTCFIKHPTYMPSSFFHIGTTDMFLKIQPHGISPLFLMTLQIQFLSRGSTVLFLLGDENTFIHTYQENGNFFIQVFKTIPSPASDIYTIQLEPRPSHTWINFSLLFLKDTFEVTINSAPPQKFQKSFSLNVQNLTFCSENSNTNIGNISFYTIDQRTGQTSICAQINAYQYGDIEIEQALTEEVHLNDITSFKGIVVPYTSSIYEAFLSNGGIDFLIQLLDLIVSEDHLNAYFSIVKAFCSRDPSFFAGHHFFTILSHFLMHISFITFPVFSQLFQMYDLLGSSQSILRDELVRSILCNFSLLRAIPESIVTECLQNNLYFKLIGLFSITDPPLTFSQLLYGFSALFQNSSRRIELMKLFWCALFNMGLRSMPKSALQTIIGSALDLEDESFNEVVIDRIYFYLLNAFVHFGSNDFLIRLRELGMYSPFQYLLLSKNEVIRVRSLAVISYLMQMNDVFGYNSLNTLSLEIAAMLLRCSGKPTITLPNVFDCLFERKPISGKEYQPRVLKEFDFKESDPPRKLAVPFFIPTFLAVAQFYDKKEVRKYTSFLVKCLKNPQSKRQFAVFDHFDIWIVWILLISKIDGNKDQSWTLLATDILEQFIIGGRDWQNLIMQLWIVCKLYSPDLSDTGVSILINLFKRFPNDSPQKSKIIKVIFEYFAYTPFFDQPDLSPSASFSVNENSKKTNSNLTPFQELIKTNDNTNSSITPLSDQLVLITNTDSQRSTINQISPLSPNEYSLSNSPDLPNSLNSFNTSKSQKPSNSQCPINYDQNSVLTFQNESHISAKKEDLSEDSQSTSALFLKETASSTPTQPQNPKTDITLNPNLQSEQSLSDTESRYADSYKGDNILDEIKKETDESQTKNIDSLIPEFESLSNQESMSALIQEDVNPINSIQNQNIIIDYNDMSQTDTNTSEFEMNENVNISDFEEKIISDEIAFPSEAEPLSTTSITSNEKTTWENLKEFAEIVTNENWPIRLTWLGNVKDDELLIFIYVNYMIDNSEKDEKGMLSYFIGRVAEVNWTDGLILLSKYLHTFYRDGNISSTMSDYKLMETSIAYLHQIFIENKVYEPFLLKLLQKLRQSNNTTDSQIEKLRQNNFVLAKNFLSSIASSTKVEFEEYQQSFKGGFDSTLRTIRGYCAMLLVEPYLGDSMQKLRAKFLQKENLALPPQKIIFDRTKLLLDHALKKKRTQAPIGRRVSNQFDAIYRRIAMEPFFPDKPVDTLNAEVSEISSTENSNEEHAHSPTVLNAYSIFNSDEFPVKLVRVNASISGILVAHNDFITFFGNKRFDCTGTYTGPTKKIIEIPTTAIKLIVNHKQTGAEIMAYSTRFFLFDFQSQNARNRFLQVFDSFHLSLLQCSPVHDGQSLIARQHLYEKWSTGQISSYEFLILLNIFNERSFNDLSAYPIMPPITFQNFRLPTPLEVATFLSLVEPFTTIANLLSNSTVPIKHDQDIKKFLMTSDFATPEFYTLSEIFGSDGAEIVSMNRKKLESNYAKEKTKQWVSVAFSPISIPFSKNEILAFTRSFEPLLSSSGTPVSTVFSSAPERLHYMDSSGWLFIHDVDEEGVKLRRKMPVKLVKSNYPQSFYATLIPRLHIVVCVLNNGSRFTAFETDDQQLGYFASPTGHSKKITSMAADGAGFLVTGSKDCSTAVWDLRKNPDEQNIRYFARAGDGSEIRNVAISSALGVAASVDSANECVVWWMETGKILGRGLLPFTPKFVLISRAGLIIFIAADVDGKEESNILIVDLSVRKLKEIKVDGIITTCNILERRNWENGLVYGIPGHIWVKKLPDFEFVGQAQIEGIPRDIAIDEDGKRIAVATQESEKTYLRFATCL